MYMYMYYSNSGKNSKALLPKNKVKNGNVLRIIYYHLILVKSAYLAAMYSMARLNKTGAELMHKYGKF